MVERPVLVIQHERTCPPGHVVTWADQAGVALDLRDCGAGDPLPQSLEAHSGCLLLGGEMGAYDDAGHPWLTTTKSLVIQAVVQSVPFLGICLGHQLAAVALGGRVVSDTEHGPHRAISPVGLLPEAQGDPLASRLTPGTRVAHWNYDVVESAPGGATVLACDPRGRIQLVRYGEVAWGVQGHPEVDAELVSAWGLGSGSASAVPDREAYLAELSSSEAELEAGWRPFAHAFFELTRSRRAAGQHAVTVMPVSGEGRSRDRISRY